MRRNRQSSWSIWQHPLGTVSESVSGLPEALDVVFEFTGFPMHVLLHPNHIRALRIRNLGGARIVVLCLCQQFACLLDVVPYCVSYALQKIGLVVQNF